MKRIRDHNINTEDFFDDRFDGEMNYYGNPWKNLTDYNEKYCLGIFDGEEILDFGCGLGGHLNDLFLSHGVKSTGVDISSSVISKNRRDFQGIDFYTLSEFDDGAISDSSIGHVVSTHVLEHVEFPQLVLSNLIKIARKTVTIITPYKKSWSDCDEHLWQFDEESFSQLAPTIVVIGKTNLAGNTEIMYHWDKRADEQEIKIAIVRNAKGYPRYIYKAYWAIRRLFPADLRSYLGLK